MTEDRTTQAVLFLDLMNSRESTDAKRYAELRRMLKTYPWAKVRATWHGTRAGRPGLYFILEGSPSTIQQSVERMSSGLFFTVYVVPDLDDADGRPRA